MDAERGYTITPDRDSSNRDEMTDQNSLLSSRTFLKYGRRMTDSNFKIEQKKVYCIKCGLSKAANRFQCSTASRQNNDIFLPPKFRCVAPLNICTSCRYWRIHYLYVMLVINWLKTSFSHLQKTKDALGRIFFHFIMSCFIMRCEKFKKWR